MGSRLLSCLCVVAVFLLAPRLHAQDDRVFKQLTAEETEAFLQSLKIDFKKTPAKKEGIVYYDFERGGHKMRLYWYNGKDLMLDIVFPRMPLDQINVWNVRAKFSRAVQVKNADKQSTSLESQIDCEGGITDGMIRQFILRFDGEIKTFVQFLTK